MSYPTDPKPKMEKLFETLADLFSEILKNKSVSTSIDSTFASNWSFWA